MSQLNIPDARDAVVMYHANCMDGFGSAYVFNVLKEFSYSDTVYIPCTYGETPNRDSVNKDKDLYILDFSFNRQILSNLSDWANKVIVLDHHKTAQADLENWEDKPANIELVFDMNRSGVGITHDYFSNYAPRPKLVDYIEDRDLWKFALAHSKPVNLSVGNTLYNFSAYRDLSLDLETKFSEVVSVGTHLKAQSDRYVEMMVAEARKCTITTKAYGVIEGLSVNTFYMFSSEVGNELAKISKTFGMTYYTDRNGDVRISLRSIGEFDVSNIAKQFGGGGHRNAAGCCLYASDWESKEGMKLWELLDVPPVL